MSLEEFGIPCVVVASRELVRTAESQARALGSEATPINTEHPIRDRTDQEIVAIADGVVNEIVAKLTGAGGA